MRSAHLHVGYHGIGLARSVCVPASNAICVLGGILLALCTRASGRDSGLDTTDHGAADKRYCVFVYRPDRLQVFNMGTHHQSR